MSAVETTVLLLLCRRNLTMLLTPMGEVLEAPVEVKGELQTKTHSARMRGVLFVLFKQLQEKRLVSEKTFESFYGEQMSHMIETLKTRLEPE